MVTYFVGPKARYVRLDRRDAFKPRWRAMLCVRKLPIELCSFVGFCVNGLMVQEICRVCDILGLIHTVSRKTWTIIPGLETRKISRQHLKRLYQSSFSSGTRTSPNYYDSNKVMSIVR